MIYFGEYLNEHRHGIGSQFDYHCGKLIYKGDFLNGKDMEQVKNIALLEKLYIEKNLLMVKELQLNV